MHASMQSNTVNHAFNTSHPSNSPSSCSIDSSWAPQNDILGHPATKAYLTASGIHSVYEAVFHGVPMLGMPIQREQLYNARRMTWMGVGILLQNSPPLRKRAQTASGPAPDSYMEEDIVRALHDVSCTTLKP